MIEIPLLTFWIVNILLARPFLHFRRFLDEYREYNDDSVALSFAFGWGVWILRLEVPCDLFSKRRTRWNFLIILIFIPLIGIWTFRAIIVLQYFFWVILEFQILEKISVKLQKVFGSPYQKAEMVLGSIVTVMIRMIS